jgi:hypothetical protein
MEAGVPNSEPGGSGEAGVSGLAGKAIRSDQLSVVNFSGTRVCLQLQADRSSDGARESRRARPGLT